MKQEEDGEMDPFYKDQILKCLCTYKTTRNDTKEGLLKKGKAGF